MNTSIATEILRLQQQCFPPFPENDIFSEWMVELIETDAFIVGLSKQAEAGQYINIRQIENQFSNIKISFENIPKEVLSADDKQTYDSSRKYLMLLDGLVLACKRKSQTSEKSQTPPEEQPGSEPPKANQSTLKTSVPRKEKTQ